MYACFKDSYSLKSSSWQALIRYDNSGLNSSLFRSYTSLAFPPQTSTVGARGSQWGWDDEDEDMGGLDAPEIEYKLTTYEEQLKRLQFLKSVVAPLVESYWVSACGLLWLRNQRFSDTEFLSALHTCAKERVQKEVTLFPESFSLEPFRNAVRVFRDWKVIQVDAEGGLTLCDAYNNEDAVFDVIEKISQFKL